MSWNFTENIRYTDPAEAKEFVERTGCTSLAIGVGTSHGVYTSDPHIEQSVVCLLYTSRCV